MQTLSRDMIVCIMNVLDPNSYLKFISLCKAFNEIHNGIVIQTKERFTRIIPSERI